MQVEVQYTRQMNVYTLCEKVTVMEQRFYPDRDTVALHEQR